MIPWPVQVNLHINEAVNIHETLLKTVGDTSRMYLRVVTQPAAASTSAAAAAVAAGAPRIQLIEMLVDAEAVERQWEHMKSMTSLYAMTQVMQSSTRTSQ